MGELDTMKFLYKSKDFDQLAMCPVSGKLCIASCAFAYLIADANNYQDRRYQTYGCALTEKYTPEKKMQPFHNRAVMYLPEEGDCHEVH